MTKQDVDKIYKQLKEASYLIWQSPQSFGQKHVVNWEDIEDIFEEFRGK
jgi:hypothetical protein